MDQITRAEIEKVHERISGLNQRVTVLETTVPHINAAVARIERVVDKMHGNVSKLLWAVGIAVIGVVVKFALDGGFKVLPPV